jgi:hypothetical protein
MPDYKSGKWATKIIDSQKDDGSWGYFHSLAMPTSGQALTTEQAINRLRRLGYTKEDAVIQKALAYMHDCLARQKETPDYREKRMDWDVFTDLMLASWIRKFISDDSLANDVATKWKTVANAAFQTGSYDPDAYINTFYEIMKPKYGTVKRHKEILRPEYYYPVSVLAGEIDERIEQAYFDYTINSKTGYYYTYQGAVSQLPEDFHSKEASRYLAAVELYCEYPNRYCKDKLKFVVDWLHANQSANGKWDMGAAVKDGTYFPLSDSWRSAEHREEDCTYRIEKIIAALQ